MANITILETLNRLKEKGIETAGYGNRSLLEISRKSSKKRPAFVKIAISDEDAEWLMKSLNPSNEKGMATFYLIVVPWDKCREVFAEERAREAQTIKEVV